MTKVNRKLDFTSFDNKKKPKKRLSPHDVDRKLNLLSFPKEAKIINDVEVKTTKDDKTNGEFQEDGIFEISMDQIIAPELLKLLPLGQKNLKFTTIGYLCPLGYNIPCKCSNKKFGKPEYVRKHLLNFHKMPRKLQKPHFTPIARTAYKKIAGSSPITTKN